jgi:hypothetical protein
MERPMIIRHTTCFQNKEYKEFYASPHNTALADYKTVEYAQGTK